MISSLNNEKIKEYAKLNDKKYRNKNNLFLIEGQYLALEAYKKGLIKEIFLLDGEANTFEGIQVTYVTNEVLKKISSLSTPPKIIAVCYKLKSTELSGNVIILDDISDPGNLGTIIRSSVAFNYGTIILSPNTVDIYNSKVLRSSEGMIFNINIIVSELIPKIEELKKNDYLIIGSDVKSGHKPLPITTKHALIIGSESIGIKKELLTLTDQNISIKMNPECESLNAAVSASILMYQLSANK